MTYVFDTTQRALICIALVLPVLMIMIKLLVIVAHQSLATAALLLIFLVIH